MKKLRPNMLSLLERVKGAKTLWERSSTSKLMKNKANLLSEISNNIVYEANAALKSLSPSETKN